MEAPRRLPMIVEPIDSNPIDAVNILSVSKSFASENRRYWRLRDILRTRDDTRMRSSSFFRLQNETWRFFSFYNTKAYVRGYRLLVTIYNFFNDAAKDQFDVRIGLLMESGKQVAVTKAKTARYMFFAFMGREQTEFESMKQAGKMIFFVEVKRKDDGKGENVPKRKLHDFKSLLLSGRYSDFTLTVQDRKFQVHRLILGDRSLVFSELMKYEWKWIEKSQREMYINDADPATFEQFLLYLYSGNEDNLNMKNVTEMYKLADKYCVRDLKELCVDLVKTNLTVENFFDIFLILQQSNTELLEIAIQFFRKDPKEIIKREKCFEFIREYPDKACVLMHSLADYLTDIINWYAKYKSES